jgi:hypothetical protein
LAWRKLWPLYRNIFICQNFERTSTSISDVELSMPFPSQPSRSKVYTPLFILLRFLWNPYRWITCLAFYPPRKEFIVYFFVVHRFSRMAILIAYKKRIKMTNNDKLFFELVWVHFWDTTDHHLQSGQQVPQHILVESLVIVGHQAH